MVAAFSSHWSQMEPLMQGLKRGGLMNQCLEDDDTYRQGRHHVMAAINQVLEWSIALEQVTACFEVAQVSYSLNSLHVAKYVVPLCAAFLSSQQIKILHISEGANFVQDNLGKVSLAVTVVATATLFVLGQQLLACAALTYLGIGILDRSNLFSEETQKRLRQTNFVIGNVAGLYFGGNFIRVMCVTNLIIAAIKQYFSTLRKLEEEKEENLKLSQINDLQDHVLDDDAGEEAVNGKSVRISLKELLRLTSDTICPINRSHLNKKSLPPVDPGVRIDEIIELSDKIDWKKHEHVIKRKLAKDKRWLEIGQYDSNPIDYFKRNLGSLVESIRDKTILQGKPQSYEMLEYYCRYIAQELKNLDEMSQADYLILLGIEGGEYCGTGKFGIVEEVFQSLISQGEGLPLEMKVFACEQQERLQVWQNIYLMTWRTNPFWQIQGYFTEVNAVHNANLFVNLIQAGQRFGIPHQAAQNDQTAVINPATHYLAFSLVHWVEDSFWNGKPIPQCYFSFDIPGGTDRLKPWKWVKLNVDSSAPVPYNQEAILKRMRGSIGTPQITTYEIYGWWNEWINRQEDLSDTQKDELCDELSISTSINGEPLELNGKIQDKFLIAMLIEMGILEKPIDWILSSEPEQES